MADANDLKPTAVAVAEMPREAELLLQAVRRLQPDETSLRVAQPLAPLVAADVTTTTGALDLRLDKFIDRCVAAIQARLSAALDATLHDDRVSGLMGTWIAIQGLVTDPDLPEDAEIHIKPARKEELLQDIRDAGRDVKRTTLYRQLVRAAYGRAGGVPYLFAVADFDIGPGADDVELAEFLATLGQKAHMPVLANADASFFVTPTADEAQLPTAIAGTDVETVPALPPAAATQEK